MAEHVVKMSLDMAQALNDLIMGLNPKGRSEMREHKHISIAFREGCCYEFKYKNSQTQKDDIQQIMHSEGGSIKITRDSAIEYIHPLLVAKIDAGVAGKFSVGYSDLMDEFDTLLQAVKGK